MQAFTEVQAVSVAALSPHPQNPRRGDVSAVKDSLKVHGQYRPIVANSRNGTIVAGHHLWQAAQELGWAEVSVAWVDVDEDTHVRMMLVDNRTSELGGFDSEALASLLEALSETERVLEGTGYDLADLLDNVGGPDSIPLATRFGAPPFTVINGRDGAWLERKRQWKALGIQSELGREGALVYDGPLAMYVNYYEVKAQAERERGHKMEAAEVVEHYGHLLESPSGGTSIFDPALTELMYRWFCPPGGRVLDPWAGGSVRGVVAGAMGLEYVGVELRPEQVEANRLQRGLAHAAGKVVRATAAAPSEAREYGPDDLTPVEEHGGYLVKRDDLFRVAGGCGGKARTCLRLGQAARARGALGLVTAGSRQSPQVNIVAGVAKTLGLGARVHVPSGGDTPEVLAAEAAGAEVHRHTPGYNTVIVARAREDAEASGWAEIPFGMECQEAVDATAEQVRALLGHPVRRVVVPVGSGMSAAGILKGLEAVGLDVPVLGVQVGADPTERLDEYAPGWRERLTLVPSGSDYHEHAEEQSLGALELDPVYEAKCLPFLEEGDLLWVVGVRATRATVPGEPVTPVWLEGDSVEVLEALEAEPFDMVLGCPPYYDLEVYSDDPRDLSTMTKEGFDAAMAANIAAVARHMRDHSFAVFVVGTVRDKAGLALDMRRCMTDAAEAAGLRLYHDAVYLTPIGSARMRAGMHFSGTRMLERVHQEVLVYVKGDRKKAAEACGDPGDSVVVELGGVGEEE